MCTRRGLRETSEKKLMFFVAQATTRVLHREDDIDLSTLVADPEFLAQRQLTISPFSQSACNVAASEASEVRENGTLKLWVGCWREMPKLTEISRISSSRVNLMALVMRFYFISHCIPVIIMHLQ